MGLVVCLGVCCVCGEVCDNYGWTWVVVHGVWYVVCRVWIKGSGCVGDVSVVNSARRHCVSINISDPPPPQSNNSSSKHIKQFIINHAPEKGNH